jgi:putative peptidoglycan lipid II flippase
VVAFFFGVGPHADVLRSAFRAPNLIQNLLGEQTLSAAFIPIYSRFLGEGRREDAGRFAGAVFGLLLIGACSVSLAGVLLARPLVTALTPGYLGDAARVASGEISIDRFEFAVTGVRILFPMTAFLALAAWTLGVLNSHRRFFLPYFAPVLWNASIIGALLYAGWSFLGVDSETQMGSTPLAVQGRVLVAAFWGGLLGGALQFLVQLPATLRVLSGFRLSLSRSVEGVTEALANVVPVMAARGAAQLSSYVDVFLASWLAEGAVSGLGNAQVLYLLPISLFALSIAAAELPELSRKGEGGVEDAGRRTVVAIRRISFFVVPTQVGYLVFGFLIVAGLYRRGEFQVADNWLVYFILAVYALGLLATAWSRMLTNVFYAAGDTRTPARIAVARIGLSLATGLALMLWLDGFSVSSVIGGESGKGELLRLGAVGLAVGSAIAAWFEWARLRARLPGLGMTIAWPSAFVAAAYGRALVALAVGSALWFFCRGWSPLPAAGVVVSVYALSYLALSRLQSVPEVRDVMRLFAGRSNSGG